MGSNNLEPNAAQPPLSATLSDRSYSPAFSNSLGSPQSIDQAFQLTQQQPFNIETPLKRFKFEEDLFTRMGINLHFPSEPSVTVSSVDPIEFIMPPINVTSAMECSKAGSF